MKDQSLAANYYIDAATCLKKVNNKEAIRVLEKAIEWNFNTGSIESKTYIKIAE